MNRRLFLLRGSESMAAALALNHIALFGGSFTNPIKMRINWYDYRDGKNQMAPEIITVDGDLEGYVHIWEIYRSHPHRRDDDYHLEYLYPDGWVNGQTHNLRLKKS